ncbi:MAG: hypothetical protein KDC87_00430, partial [Planctomycetes bacterium]|nr:hypothetical protein [Planctomycetota bacterium]
MATLALLAGCAFDIVRDLPAPPTEAVRAELDSVELVVLGDAAPADVDVPGGSMAGFVHGAGRLGLVPVLGGALSSTAEGVLVGTALAPVFALAGGVWGAVAAPRRVDVDRAGRRVEWMLDSSTMRAELRRAILTEARRDAAAGFAAPGSGRSTVFVTIQRTGLTGAWLLRGELRLFCRVRAQLVRASDRALLH